MAQTIQIHRDYITLGQLLKLAGVVSTGGEVKDFLAEGTITVNGEPDNRRGRKLRPGDVVNIEGHDAISIAEANR